ncbi:MAG: OB-fold domain-containing protein [bacterium]
MSTAKTEVPAVEGWFAADGDGPHLIGGQCEKCGTFSFPREPLYCKNPACDSSAIRAVPLSRRGRIWSYTNACYQPPPPYVAAQPFVPFAIAAVELEREGLVVMGQLAEGVRVEDVRVGQEVELIVETLFEDAERRHLVWKWKPLAA